MGCIHGCMLSVLCDVLVAITMVLCAQRQQCINAAGSKTISCSVSPLHEGCKIATNSINLCTDPVDNNSLICAHLIW